MQCVVYDVVVNDKVLEEILADRTGSQRTWLCEHGRGLCEHLELVLEPQEVRSGRGSPHPFPGTWAGLGL